jgi:hypothetical protein
VVNVAEKALLQPREVGVITPHVAQAAAVAARLADLPGVLIGTANQAQGSNAKPWSSFTRWPATAKHPHSRPTLVGCVLLFPVIVHTPRSSSTPTPTSSCGTLRPNPQTTPPYRSSNTS